MKKIFSVLLVACILLLPVTVAYADVIVEPQNDFYLFSGNDFEYLGQAFTANAAGSTKTEPGSATDAATFSRGQQLYVYCTYKLGGARWGLVVNAKDPSTDFGWVLMSGLTAVNMNPATGGSPPATLSLMAIPVAIVALGAAVVIRRRWNPGKSN